MSAVMVGDRVADRLIADGGEFYHGFTYSGHPVAAAVALANLDLIERENMIETVRDDTGPYLASALASLADHRLVGEVRTFGLLAAIELVKSKDGPVMFEDTGTVGGMCRDHAIQRGLMMRAVRDAMILSPALSYTRADIDETVAIARKALDATAADLGL
jgi:putrescine aminotransferase